MTEDELKQFNELIAKFEPKDKEAVITAIKEKAHDVFQDINDGGRAAANRDNQDKIKKLEDDVKAAGDNLKKAQDDLKAAESKTTGATELREKYETDLKKAQEAFDEKEKAFKEQLAGERHKVAVGKLVDTLVDKFQIEPEYAKTIIAKRDDVNGRISVDEKGKITVWKDVDQELPLVAPNDETTVIDVFAKQLADKIEPKWKTSKVKRGSSTRGSGGDDAPEGDGAEFDQIRKEAEERNKASTEQSRSRKGGLERLGVRR